MQYTQIQTKNNLFLCILDNYVDGQVLFQLTEQDLLDMIQPIGIVKNVMSLILRDQVIASLYTFD